MSALVDAPAGVATDGGAGGSSYDVGALPPASRPSTRRRVVVWGSVALLVVLVGALMTWGAASGPTAVPLDPRNPTATGSLALARVLESHGVTVDVVRGQDALQSVLVNGDTTVLVTRTDDLAQQTVEALAARTIGAERLVVVTPLPFVLRYLDPEVTRAETQYQRDDVPTACSGSSGSFAGDVRGGEQLSHTQAGYRYGTAASGGGTSGATACWVDPDGFAAYLGVPATDSHAPLVLLGSSSAIVNDEIDEADNAAVVLRTLGHSSRVVWYVPDSADIPTTDRSRTGELLPPWLAPGLALVAVAVLGLMLWRGRRLGRLVREPLPVVVRAIETTQSRGRLYRKARDSPRAAAVLREATCRRLAVYLGLPPGGPGDVLVRATAAATGRPEPEVGYLLAGPPPMTDDDLLGLAGQLAALEKEVRRT